jgi:hypothetical protein
MSMNNKLIIFCFFNLYGADQGGFIFETLRWDPLDGGTVPSKYLCLYNTTQT